MTSIIDTETQDYIVEAEAQDATITHDEVLHEIEIDLLGEIVRSGLPTYSRPRGYGSRPVSGPVDTGAGQRSH